MRIDERHFDERHAPQWLVVSTTAERGGGIAHTRDELSAVARATRPSRCRPEEMGRHLVPIRDVSVHPGGRATASSSKPG